MKTLVYTSIFGGYDKLLDPKNIETEFDYKVYSDTKYNSAVWKSNIIKPAFDSTRNARYIKTQMINIDDSYDYYIWIDGCITVTGDLKKYFDIMGNKEGLFVSHPSRDCIYNEIHACAAMNKDRVDVMQNQINKYKKQSFPNNYGLAETNFFILKNTKTNKQFVKYWFSEILQHSKRDQLSFPVALKKFNLKDKFVFISPSQRNEEMIWDNRTHN